jgi:hypothetical protein
MTMRTLNVGFVFALGLGACAAPVDEFAPEGDLSTDESTIIGGAEVFDDSIGTARVLNTGLLGGGTGTCSGTILHSRWVMTARHCVTNDGTIAGPLVTPASIRANLLGGTNQPTGVQISAHLTLDVALVRLNGAPLNAVAREVNNRLYLGNVGNLVFQSLNTQGWGNDVITNCSPAPVTGTGVGTLRSAILPISGATGSMFTTAPNGIGQIGFTGDSGSSLYQPVNGLSRPIGVFSTLTCNQPPPAPGAVPTVTSGNYSRVDAFRGWAQGVIGFAPAAGTPAGYERSDGANAIVYTSPDSPVIKELAIATNGNWGLSNLNAATGSYAFPTSELSAYVRGDGVNSIVFRGPNSGHVFEFGLNGTTWQAQDISGSNTPAAIGARPAGFLRDDGRNVVMYRGSDNHIHELARRSNGTWSHLDWSGLLGAPAAAGDPIGYVRADGIYAVTYRSTAAHVIELPSTGGWFDLSSVVGATDAGRAVVSGPRPYTRPDGVSAVIYVDANHTVQEMALVGGIWGIASFAGRTGTTTNFATPYIRSDGIGGFLYVNSDGHVREAALRPTGWSVTDLTTATGAPIPLNPLNGTGSIVNGYVRGDGLTTVVYQASNYHIIEMARVGSSWFYNDLTNVVGSL